MRFFSFVVVIGVLTVPGAGPHAQEHSTEHLFTFSTGTDIDEVGEREFESDTGHRFSKRDGRYNAYSLRFEAAFIPVKDFRLAASASGAYLDIAGVSGLDDRRRAAFEEFSLEVRYRLMDRARSPFGLTIGIEPNWGLIEETSGEPADRYGVKFALLIDKWIVEGSLVSVFNVIYEPEATHGRATGEWSRESTLGFTGALMAQVRPNVFIGAEVQHLRKYEGFGLDHLAGDATFLGPSLCWNPKGFWLAASWGAQIVGHAVGSSDHLDLVNFERYRARLRVGFNF
jgi:hypothetical protein